MSQVTIRRMREDDLLSVLDVIAQHSDYDAKCARQCYERWFREGDISPDVFLIASEGNRIVGTSGFVRSTEAFDVYWLGWTYVNSADRGRGVGSSLLRYVEDELRHRSCRRLFVDTGSTPDYADALAFYRRRDFRFLATLSDYYAEGEDMLVLAKNL
jgi:ribosomal protein S18 acetylase RimI-like enzyme